MSKGCFCAFVPLPSYNKAKTPQTVILKVRFFFAGLNNYSFNTILL